MTHHNTLNPALAHVGPVMIALIGATAAHAKAPQPGSLDVSGFVAEIDRNRDGCASEAEWQRAGAPMSSYRMLKNDAGCVTVAGMSAVAPPPGIDANRDGRLTLAEMKVFDKRMSAQMKARPTISDGERAAATWAVQNLMSRHEYMHAAGLNLEEIDSFWVSRQGAYAKTATFASPAWVMNGIETVRAAYGQGSRKDAEAARQALAGIDTGVKDTEAFFGAGAEWVMHTSTTPLIEIAGDGKTAQGAWYSPGMGIMPKVVNGKVHLQAMMFWEKYGADFVKEDGVWKIWHLQMAYDFVPGLPKEMVEEITKRLGELAYAGVAPQSQGEAGERMGGALPPGFSKPKYVYPAYSPQRPAVIWPNLPRPYYTFGETFNNCNCDQ